MDPRESFLAHVRTPDFATEVHDLRLALTNLKGDALRQVAGVEPDQVPNVMPSVYEQNVQLLVHLAGHVGVGVAYALSMLDEHHSGASLSRFDRELRDQMTDISNEMTTRQGSRLMLMIAHVESQRLVWRHSHEFMSWLAFRRGDERYPARDRLERIDAFGVQQRLLDARAVVVRHLGVRLSAALEGVDRFMLSNRWRLADTPEHALERYVWPLLSYMPASTVRIERARWEYDCVVESGASADTLEGERSKLAGLFEAQLAEALGDAPPSAMAGAF